MNNKGADQTARMRRLVCDFVVRKPRKTGFLASRLICIQLSYNFLFQLIGPNFLVADEVLSEPGLVNELESLIIDTLILLGADRDTAEADGKAILEFELNLQLVS